MSFSSLGLTPEIAQAVTTGGYTTPTTIQQQAIPAVLRGRDIMASAQTGTGKTAAFTLPMLQRLAAPNSASTRGRPVRGLILVPTRELAAQVMASVRDYGRTLALRSYAIHGGVNIKPEINALRRGLDIVVATPGRLLDHLNQGTIDLSRIEMLVLDEADRMLDMGFIHDVRRILGKCGTNRQTLLFSATLSKEIQGLARDFLKEPETIAVTPDEPTVDAIDQLVHPVDRTGKRALLSHLVESGAWQQVLVFSRTKHGANRLAQQLSRDGLDADAIHGNKTQAARTRSLQDFKRGGTRILVATDIAARGLDIENLPHVVNYDLPNVAADYVHRIGRTGRAGRAGQAVSLVCADEAKLLSGIEKHLNTRIPRQVVSGHEPSTELPSAGKAGAHSAKRPSDNTAAGRGTPRPNKRRYAR